MSKVIDLWEAAAFEQVAEMSINRHKRRDIRSAIRESRYALKLMEAAQQADRPTSGEGVFEGPIRVVTVLHASLPHHTGGYTGRAQGLLHALKSRGVELRAYTRPGFYSERVDSKAAFPFAVDEVDGVNYRHLPAETPRKRGEYQYMFDAIEWYRKMLLVENPNVVHVRSTYLIALPAAIAAHQLGIPVVYEVSGLWELVYEGRGEMGRAKRTQRFEDLTCATVDRVVAMNRSMADLLEVRAQNWVLSVDELPNAVDTTRFSGISPLQTRKVPGYDVGYIGSLVDYEGLSTLLEAISMADAEGFRITAKIVGGGAEHRKLEELASSLRIDDRIDFKGRVPASEAVLQFEDVNVVVLPRLSKPATEIVTPLKPFEAMAAGRPLLVSDVAALAEVSREGTCAAVFRSGDAEDLKEQLISLLRNPIRQRELVENARDLVEQEHNWNLVAERMENYLRSVAIPRSELPCLPDVRTQRSGAFSWRVKGQ